MKSTILKYINKLLAPFKNGNGKLMSFGKSKARLIKENNDETSTIFEERFLKFLLDNKEELSYCLRKHELSNFNRLDGLIDLIHLMKSRIKS